MDFSGSCRHSVITVSICIIAALMMFTMHEKENWRRRIFLSLFEHKVWNLAIQIFQKGWHIRTEAPAFYWNPVRRQKGSSETLLETFIDSNWAPDSFPVQYKKRKSRGFFPIFLCFSPEANMFYYQLFWLLFNVSLTPFRDFSLTVTTGPSMGMSGGELKKNYCFHWETLISVNS